MSPKSENIIGCYNCVTDSEELLHPDYSLNTYLMHKSGFLFAFDKQERAKYMITLFYFDTLLEYFLMQLFCIIVKIGIW